MFLPEPRSPKTNRKNNQHPSQPVVSVAQYPPGHKWHGEVFWLHISTDNLRTYTSCDEMQHEFMEWCGGDFAPVSIPPISMGGLALILITFLSWGGGRT